MTQISLTLIFLYSENNICIQHRNTNNGQIEDEQTVLKKGPEYNYKLWDSKLDVNNTYFEINECLQEERYDFDCF